MEETVKKKLKRNPKMNGLDPEVWKRIPKYMRPFLREGGRCVTWLNPEEMWARVEIRKVWVDDGGIVKARVKMPGADLEGVLDAMQLRSSILSHYSEGTTVHPNFLEAMAMARAVVEGREKPSGCSLSVDRAKRNISLLLKLEYLRREKLLRKAERERDKALSELKTHRARGRKRIVVIASCKNCCLYPTCASSSFVGVCGSWRNAEGSFAKYLREQSPNTRRNAHGQQ